MADGTARPAWPSRPHADLPGDGFWLTNARVPAAYLADTPPAPVEMDGSVAVHIRVAGGKIAGVVSAAEAIDGAEVDLDQGQVWPCPVDLHTHLDKDQTWNRTQNPDGTFGGAIASIIEDRLANWSESDLAARFDFALRCAHAQGTKAVRTHLDSPAEQAAISWAAFRRMRDAWSGRIDLQATSLVPIDTFATPFGKELADIVADSGGVLGAVTRQTGKVHSGEHEGFKDQLGAIFALAAERGLDLDFHVDETHDPSARALLAIAETARRLDFKGKVNCGHCCSLAVQDEAHVARTIAACVDAGLSIVSLPSCNIYLQERIDGRTPRWRGVTLLHELAAAGVPVAIAGDNCRDAFHAYGDHDMIEVFAHANYIAHLDRPIGAWLDSIARIPGEVMRLQGTGRIGPGAPADVIAFRGRSHGEVLARVKGDRLILRHGKAIDTALPDFRELDDIAPVRFAASAGAAVS